MKQCLIFRKGSFPYISYKREGSLSIEAIVIIPLFLIATISIISIINIMRIDIKIRQAIYEEAKVASLKLPYDEEYGIDEVSTKIRERLGDEVNNSPYLDKENGGIDFSKSDLSNPEIINITAIYNAKIPFDLFGICSISLSERVVSHSWSGYRNGLNGQYKEELIVYITENSGVYHLNKECSHIKLNIIKTSGSEVEKLRNSNGEKYKNCKLCKSNIDCNELYITSDGDRYHSSLSCSGVKRTIHAVYISKVRDKRPCQRCGY